MRPKSGPIGQAPHRPRRSPGLQHGDDGDGNPTPAMGPGLVNTQTSALLPSCIHDEIFCVGAPPGPAF